MSERITFVEIELPVCQLTYGESPCEAELGETGDKKCFNSRKTCQDLANYDEGFETLRLAKPSSFLPLGITAVANIQSVNYTPSRLMLGESIGVRSKLTVTCGDHPFPDTGPGGDPYRDERPYDPYHQGTFWGKIKARQPYLRGRILRWYTGGASQNLDQMERRTFVIDRVEGPSTNGQFTIIAKDPLTVTDDKRAQAPVLSRGVLLSPIDESQTTATLAPAGIGDEEYPASGKVAIGGNEICEFTRSDDTLTLTRGVNNTEAQEHDEDDRVQLCLEYTGEDPGDIISDLLTTYGNTPSSFINIGNWNAETSEFLGRVYTGIIAEPVAVDELINEILQQSAITIWWDEFGEQIRLQVLRDITQGTFVYNDDFIMGGTFGQKDQPEKRVSQVWTYYGQINPLESQDDPKNYRNTLRTVNLLSEANHGSAAIKTIYSRWITQFGRTAVERLNNLIISRYAEPPKLFSFELLRSSGTPLPTLGSGARVESFFNQDDEGIPQQSPVQVVQAKASDSSVKYQVEEVVIAEDVELDDPTVKVVPIDSDADNFNLREAYLQIYAEANPGDKIICDVREGIVVSSNSTSSAAWDSGSGWPSDVTLEMIVRDGATIAGRGGRGGQGGSNTFGLNANDGGNGQPGGLGMLIRSSIEITNNGTIGGGGGGGGGGGAANARVAAGTQNRNAASGGGGGGGGGAIGSGGSGGTVLDSADDGINGASGNNASRGFRGAGGESFTATITINPGSVRASATAKGGVGGNGGGLGQSGLGAGQAEATATFTSGSGAEDENIGSPGQGGPPGPAIDGDSLITFIDEGTILGARIN